MIEYMIILVIMLLLFNSISLDLVNTATEDASFLQMAEMINASKMVISDATKIVALQGSGAKRTVQLRAPPDCDYVLNIGSISTQCSQNSRFYQNFTGQTITPPNVPAGVSFNINGGIIRSGNLGTVTVSKT